MRILVLILASFLFTACTNTTKTAFSSPSASPDKWQGKTVAELTAALGTPNMTNLAANGNTEYIYNTPLSQPSSIPFSTRAATIVAPGGTTVGVNEPQPTAQPAPVLRECVVIYEISPQGLVAATRMRGKGC